MSTTIDDVARLARRHGAVDLVVGSIDGGPEPEVRAAGVEAMRDGDHQYGDTRGLRALRHAIVAHVGLARGINYDPSTEVIVTNGATAGLASFFAAHVRPGDEVVVISPCYSEYPRMARAFGARVREVRLAGDRWELDGRRLAAAFCNRTAAVVVNDPANPTGRIYTADERRLIAELCCEFDVLCVADEVYAAMTFDGTPHVSIASCDGMRERSVLVDSLSKTFAVPGWRIGFAAGPARLVGPMCERHEIMTGGAPASLEPAAVRAFEFSSAHHDRMRRDLERRRDYFCRALARLGFGVVVPQGGIFAFVNIRPITRDDASTFTVRMIREAGVAAVPGECFFVSSRGGNAFVRFCFARDFSVLNASLEALARWLDGASSSRPVERSRSVVRNHMEVLKA